jgi:UDP-N-acetylmuramoyl-L-alanyl-D-glutamate--2,6-diaminopimelate ligase
MILGKILPGERLRQPLTPELAAVDVRGLAYDSRRVQVGDLFFAFPGSHADGRQFAQDAMARGAVAVVAESPAPEDLAARWLQVEHGRQSLAVAARNFYGKPDERLGLTTAMIGTIEYHVAGRVLPAVNTTPESLDLMKLFTELEQVGGTHVTMEVSSHSLALGRVYALAFHTVVFTNLTRDHLDFHGDMDTYFAAKQLLFDGAGGPPPKFAVLNRDDEYARQIKLQRQTEVLWYGLGQDPTVRARHINSGIQGLRFDVQFGKLRFAVESPLIGKINVYNILAASAAGLSYGIAPEAVARGIAALQAVPGRFERVDEGQPFVVAVDYAHTDAALRNTIAVARGLTPKRIITLFGCGGDRDRSKRPLMGQAAAEASDFVVLTSDNPRSEDPLAIMNDALVGIRRVDVPHVVEPDRATAIARALKEAREGDIVILAGKGHETYQVLKDRTIEFDDRAVAREVLKGYGY